MGLAAQRSLRPTTRQKGEGAPWQALTLKAVQTKDQAMHFGLSLIVAGWLATGGE